MVKIPVDKAKPTGADPRDELERECAAPVGRFRPDRVSIG
jgi:hypothetical protein